MYDSWAHGPILRRSFQLRLPASGCQYRLRIFRPTQHRHVCDRAPSNLVEPERLLEFRRRHGVFVNTEIRDHVNKFAEPMLAHVEGEIGHHECLGIGDVFEGRYQGARRSPAAKAWVQRLLISRGSRSHSTVRAEHEL
jgi:hypothetical protein